MSVDEVRAPAAPTTPLTAGRRLLYSIRIRRVEYLAVMLAIYSIPTLLSVESASTLLTVDFALVIVMALSVMHFIDMTNAYADRDVDAVYKTRLSEAVYGLGLRNVRVQIAVTGVGVMALAVYHTLRTGNWDLLPLVAFTLYIGAQYSIPPIHLKNSGVFQIPGLAAVLLWLPMLIVVRSIPGELTWPLLAVIVGFGLNQVGIVMVNTAEDWPEDAAFDITTCVRALGLTRAMAVATGLIAVGGTTVCVSIISMGFTWGALPMVAAIAFALFHVSGTWRGVRGKTLEDALAFLRPRAKFVPLQVASTGWGTVIAAAFVLAG
ncbi:UbiA family prenyltransferase [Saccharothrix variisporea]|uniref:1,4-dihydroxy-2-naphthoate octaprenyltransferase n=1 Tax=Saccharothrix variisporea TaxID=543527 RepID=A0A495XF78_9PSEU|nr:UbiA family prenyltransferase [Saccharothrix variisporea]RKT70208.1 1,4-dihydroxy-2-naphthoate octaprenyltransferase [Saccharothrix variisporea]